MFFTRAKRFFVLSYHLFYAMLQMLYGSWRISKLSMPIITIFGSSRMGQNTPYALKAKELAQRFIDNDISVMTGGGPGIMESASCKIKLHGKARTIGINVRNLEVQPKQCMSEYFELEYFFARKWLLTQFSVGFVIFPGGFGTIDEMAGVLTLIQTKNLKKVPVVLIGREYWDPFVKWITTEALAHGTIIKQEIEFFYLTDDLDEAFNWVLGQSDFS